MRGDDELSAVKILKVENRKQLRNFVKFPWIVYQNDQNWIPPLINSQISKLDPQSGVFYQQGEAEAFVAIRQNTIVGTVVPWMNHRANVFRNEKSVGFGFFEMLEDYEIAHSLLATVCDWARQRGATIIRGPLYFSPQDSPGVLIKGFDTLPPPMVGHTPAYYAPFLEKFGFMKHRDAFAYKIDLTPFRNNINNLPSKLVRVANGVANRYKIKIRNLNMDHWDNEIQAALFIFNEALGYQREGVPMDEAEFIKMTSDLKPIVDPKLVYFAEIDNQPIGLYIAIPNINEVLRQINGRLFPFGWYKLANASKYITLLSTKVLGVLDEYRNKGVDALFYTRIAREAMARGHQWIDYSLVAEENQMANRIVQRMGGTVYKICRTYYLEL